MGVGARVPSVLQEVHLRLYQCVLCIGCLALHSVRPLFAFCAFGRSIAGSVTTSKRGGQRGLEIRSLKARSKDFVWDARQATVPRAETQGR